MRSFAYLDRSMNGFDRAGLRDCVVGYDDGVVDFDDLVNFDDGSEVVDASALVARRALALAAARRSCADAIAPSVKVDVLGRGAVAQTILGFDLPRDAAPGEEPVLGEHPIFDAIRRGFSVAIPASKLIRIDDADSYAEFRRERAAPHVADFDRRLSTLERAVADHVADNHGGGRVARVERLLLAHLADPGADAHRLGSAILAAAEQAKRGGLPVALPGNDGVECWQDGGELICSTRVPGPNGEARVATTSTPLEGWVDEAVGCAIGAGGEVEDVVAIAPRLARICGGWSLASEIARAAPAIVSRRGRAPIVGIVRPLGDASRAAAMALLQLCQRGDRRACEEVSRMGRRGYGRFLLRAGEALGRAQREKARRL